MASCLRHQCGEPRFAFSKLARLRSRTFRENCHRPAVLQGLDRYLEGRAVLRGPLFLRHARHVDRTRERERAVKQTFNTIDFAERLGAPFVVLHCGQVPMNPITDELIALAKKGELLSRAYVRRKLKAVKKREENAPWLPSVLFGVSYGGFGAGIGGQSVPGHLLLRDRVVGSPIWQSSRVGGIGAEWVSGQPSAPSRAPALPPDPSTALRPTQHRYRLGR